jgi:hypothetical protein
MNVCWQHATSGCVEAALLPRPLPTLIMGVAFDVPECSASWHVFVGRSAGRIELHYFMGLLQREERRTMLLATVSKLVTCSSALGLPFIAGDGTGGVGVGDEDEEAEDDRIRPGCSRVGHLQSRFTATCTSSVCCS